MRKLPAHRTMYFFTVSLLFLEIWFKIGTDQNINWNELLLSFFFMSASSILLYGIVRLLNARKQFAAFLILLAFFTLIYCSQFLYYRTFHMYYSWYSFSEAGQIFPFWREIFTIGLQQAIWLWIFFLPVVLFILYRNWLFTPFYMRLRSFAKLLVLSGLFFSAALAQIHLDKKGEFSFYHLYYLEHHPQLAVERLGLLTAMRLDIQRQWTGWSPQREPVHQHSPAPSQKKQASPDKKKPRSNKSEQNQVLDIDFQQLMDRETNEEIIELHRYFANEPPTKTNAYTGMFKDYNLILITAEAFSHLAIHPEITPTLHKLATEGFQFTEFYTPIWEVSTSDGEYVALTGLLPKSGVWSFQESSHIYLPFTLGNQLRKLGYTTKAYHNHTYDYYGRHLSHPNIGYDYKGLGNGLNVTETWPESDVEMMELTVSEYVDKEPFHAYYMTVSGHLLYTFTGNYIAYKNKELVDHLPYSEEAKAYLATQIELDRALEYLLNELEKAGVLDRTLIAISSDHYPYGLDKKTIDELAGHEVEENFELYRNAFIVYASGMDPVRIDKPASSLDILPTLSNLLGLEYDSRLLMGRDILSDAPPLVVFLNRSFITDKGKFNAETGEFIPHDGVQVDDEYIEQIKASVADKFYYSRKILETDYYSTLNLQ